MRQKYVCGFLRGEDDWVLLVRKNTPAWQAGKLNGVGGKIEENEKPDDAMKREWTEEIGEGDPSWRKFCVVSGNGYEVHFYAADFLAALRHGFSATHNDVGEELVTFELAYILDHDDVIPNLKWLLPMAFYDTAKPTGEVVDMGLPGEGV